jgi:hypothetical protein
LVAAPSVLEEVELRRRGLRLALRGASFTRGEGAGEFSCTCMWYLYVSSVLTTCPEAIQGKVKHVFTVWKAMSGADGVLLLVVVNSLPEAKAHFNVPLLS